MDPDFLPNLLTTARTYYTNVTTNLSSSISTLTVQDYIRLVWIIGGYLFLRPYIDKGFEKLLNSANKKEEEKEMKLAASGDAEAAKRQRRAVRRAKREANALRGGSGAGADADVEEEDSSSEDEDGDGDADQEGKAVPKWGKSARRRQKMFFKKLEEDAERKAVEDEDKDIEDLLED